MANGGNIAIIPVRGGSRGIPRKNARLLNGKPLLAYSIEACLKAKHVDCVYVSTDDDELAEIAARFGAQVLPRPVSLAQDAVGLDDVIADAVQTVESADKIEISQVVTVQATCPLISSHTIDAVCEKQLSGQFDTVLTVVDDTHLAWEVDDTSGQLSPLYEARVNRQLLPRHFRETGGVVACDRKRLDTGSRFGPRVGAVEISKSEAIDIDDYFDWWMAEKSLRRKHICFYVTGNRQNGLGHVYRTLTLADRLIDHDLSFVVNEESELAAELIRRRFYPVDIVPVSQEADRLVEHGADLVINDVLDTEESFMCKLKEAGIATVNFEDVGPGSLLADCLINAMYDQHPVRGDEMALHGIGYCCLRDDFYSIQPIEIRPEIKNVLLLFGGTDPNGLTRKCFQWLDSLDGDWSITVVVGVGFPDMDGIRQLAAQASHPVEVVCDTSVISRYMAAADVAVTSAGRTVFELACLGIPMLVTAQNDREMAHVFASQSQGTIFCGRGNELSESDFVDAFGQLSTSSLLRQKMSENLLASGVRQGIEQVLSCIDKVINTFQK